MNEEALVIKRNRERRWSVILATFIAALGPVTFGYCMGYSSAATTQLRWSPEKVNSTELYLTEDELTWFGSLLNIGAMIGGPLAGFLVDFLGRKIALMLSSVPFCAGYCLIGFGSTPGMLISGRFLSGLGVGMASMNVPLYISETASQRMRGSMGAVNQLGIVSGILLSYVVGWALDWRWSGFVGAFPPALLIILMAFMPETARWYMSKQKEENAAKTLKWLRGPEVETEIELEEIKNSIDGTKSKGRFSLREFLQPGLYRPFAISLTLHFFQQFSGINAVMFYCATIFEKAGFQDQSTLIPIIIGVAQFLSSVASLFIIDRQGRRFLLLSTSVLMSISLIITGVYFYMATGNTHGSWIAVTTMSIYIIGFASGWGPCTWLIMSEVLPLRARGIASGICTFFNWFCSFIITKTFSYMIDSMSEAGVFWFFGFIMVASIFFVNKCVFETKGKSLEEIQTYFESFGKKDPKNKQEIEDAAVAESKKDPQNGDIQA